MFIFAGLKACLAPDFGTGFSGTGFFGLDDADGSPQQRLDCHRELRPLVCMSVRRRSNPLSTK
jgi:hypothetical protein